MVTPSKTTASRPDLGDSQQGEPDTFARHILQDVLDDHILLFDLLHLGIAGVGQTAARGSQRFCLDLALTRSVPYSCQPR